MSVRRLRLSQLEDRLAPATIQWDGGLTGNGTNWLDPVNWKGDVLPGAADTAQLDATGTSPVISIAGSVSVQVVASTRTLSIGAGGILTVGAGSSLLSIVSLAGGTLDFSNGSTVSAATFQGAGSLTIPASRTVTLTLCSSDLPIDVKGTLLVGSEFTSNGNFNVSNGGTVRISGDTTTTTLNVNSGLTNNGTIELTSGTAGQKALVNISGGSFTNTTLGKIVAKVGSGGPRVVHLASASNQLINQGALTVEGGLSITRTGSGQQVTNSGTITVNPGQLLTVDTSMTFTGGSLIGSGSVTLNSLKLDAALTPSLASLSLGGLTGSGKLTIPVSGVVTARPGSNLQAPIDHSGLLIVRGSCSIGSGLTSKTGSAIRIEGEPSSGSANLHATAAFTNHGIIDLTSSISSNNASLSVDAGSFVNASDGTIRALPGVGGNRYLHVNPAGQFTNQGSLAVSSVDLFHTGQPIVNTGTINLAVGTTLSTTAVVTNNVPGIFKGAGTVKTGGFSGSGSITPDGSLRFTNCNPSFSGPLVVDLNGTSAGSFDQLKVTGLISLGGPLTVNIGFATKVNDEFLIVENDGAEAVGGGFTNLLPGDTIKSGSTTFQVNYSAGSGNDVSLKVLSVSATPASATLQVNDGNAQRSIVTSLAITFSEPVTFPSGVNAGFRLLRVGPGGPVGDVQLTITGSGADYLVTFVDEPIFTQGLQKSLIDGQYTFTLDAMKIVGSGGPFNGAVDQSWNFHRLFGDGDGDAAVTSNDFAMFRGVFGTGASIFDFDGNNSTNSDDFAEFRRHFGLTI